MKKKLTLTIDGDVYDEIGELPRKVSISEAVSLFLRMMIEAYKPGGMTSEEFAEYMQSDDRRREVFKYLQEKLNPVFDTVDSKVAVVKDLVRKKNKPKKKK